MWSSGFKFNIANFYWKKKQMWAFKFSTLRISEEVMRISEEVKKHWDDQRFHNERRCDENLVKFTTVSSHCVRLALSSTIWNLWCNNCTNPCPHLPNQWIDTPAWVSITMWPTIFRGRWNSLISLPKMGTWWLNHVLRW